MVDSGEARKLEGEAAPNGEKRHSKLVWHCLFSRLALALIEPDTGSGFSWRTLALYGAIRPRPCSGLVLALTCPSWLAWLCLV